MTGAHDGYPSFEILRHVDNDGSALELGLSGYFPQIIMKAEEFGFDPILLQIQRDGPPGIKAASDNPCAPVSRGP